MYGSKPLVAQKAAAISPSLCPTTHKTVASDRAKDSLAPGNRHADHHNGHQEEDETEQRRHQPTPATSPFGCLDLYHEKFRPMHVKCEVRLHTSNTETYQHTDWPAIQIRFRMFEAGRLMNYSEMYRIYYIIISCVFLNITNRIYQL